MDDSFDAAKIILLFVVLPVWLAAGLADYFCHRYSKIETTAGPFESVLHLAGFASIGVPVTAALFLQINAGLMAVMAGCIVPRPIGFISTIDGAGTFNAAPFSFFNMVSHIPPMVSVSIARNRAGDGLSETFERAPKNLGVDRLLGLEVKVERSRGIARICGDRPQRRPLQTLGFKDRPCRVEDQLALQLADGPLSADFLLFRHRDSL